MIAVRILRQCRPPPTLTSRSALSSLSTLETRPAVLRRDFCLLRRHHADTIERSGCLSDRRRHQHARWLSTTSSDAGPPIEVTVTSSSSSSDASSSSSSEDSISDAEETTSQSSSQSESAAAAAAGPNLSKSSDQITEEQILELQSELRTHHRHAAYDAALTTATELLDASSSHFGNLHPATASAHNNVGLMNKLLGRYGDAKEAYHEALRIYGEVVGKDHASYAAALSNLGMLERGRVLESEAAEEEEGDGDHGENNNATSNEDGMELEELRDGNTPETTKMSALERMQLNESAIEYFDEAYRIRRLELGSNHPHTITSRSQLGSAMAAAVVAERKGRIGGLVESELRNLKRSRDVKDAQEMEAYVPEAIARAAAKSSSGSRLTQRRWEAAEEHLRGALATAVDNPRGESVGPLMFLPLGNNGANDDDEERQGGHNNGGLTLPKKDRSLSKKERKRMEKERKREKRQANLNALQGSNSGGGNAAADSNNNTSVGGKVAVQGAAGKVTTLSAATAAQNLAVFLKNYADWLRLTLMDESNTSSSLHQQQGEGEQLQILQQVQITKLNKTLQEARHLYESALHVRSTILPPHHPEVVAAKFSLAELLDSPKVVGAAAGGIGRENGGEVVDGARANALREEILSAYNVEEREDGGVSNTSN
ncbi:hypothetical protein ACHAXR_007789 [Thalassiosira sp. AJA248-18]